MTRRTTDEQAAGAIRSDEEIGAAFSNLIHRKGTMSIPVQREDDDIVVGDALRELRVLRRLAEAAGVLVARVVLGIPPKSDTARVVPEHIDPPAWWDDIDEKVDAYLAIEREYEGMPRPAEEGQPKSTQPTDQQFPKRMSAGRDD